MKTPACNFELGEIVAMPGFTDCFGKVHPRVEMLVVTERRLIETKERAEFSMPPYWRIKAAYNSEGFNWYEGAERYFEKSGETTWPQRSQS